MSKCRFCDQEIPKDQIHRHLHFCPKMNLRQLADDAGNITLSFSVAALSGSAAYGLIVGGNLSGSLLGEQSSEDLLG
jgi:hypothetical protein